MKQSLLKCLLLAAICIKTLCICADDFWLNNSISTQVEGMIRYGDVETSLYTGRLNFSIPIYSLKDPDFNLNIILSYNSDGFKPLKSSGWVGYNWSLQAGGCITREVRGYADEIYRYYRDNIKIRGMLNFLSCNDINKYDIYEQDTAKAMTDCGDFVWGLNIGKNNCNVDIEYLPDIYHFNFMGYSGSFMINNEGKTQIISGDYIDVDLSRTIEFLKKEVPTKYPNPLSTSEIRVKTNDGYTYIFGGDISALEYSYSLEKPRNEGPKEMMQTPPIICSWHLTKVIAPNMRTITYRYKEFNKIKLDDESLLVFNIHRVFEPSGEVDDNPESPKKPNVDYELGFSQTKECVLESISVSGEHPIKICFYNDTARKMYNHNHYARACHENYQLDSILVVSDGRVLHKANLTYEYKNDNSEKYTWRFLSDVSLSGRGSYKLVYDNNQKMTYPSLYIIANDGLINLIDFYEYWKETSLRGLLSDVYFPTGGAQHFEYEMHNYATERKKCGVRDSDGNYKDVEQKSIYSEHNQTIGGVRIRQIDTYDQNNHLAETRIFNYNKEGTSSSSGIYYNNMGIYMSTDDMSIIPRTLDNYSLIDSHIGYSYVEERAMNDEKNELYKNVYSFDTGLDYYTSENDPSIKRGIHRKNYGINSIIASYILSFHENFYTKGKMLSHKYYEKNSLVKSIVRKYNGGALPRTEFISMNPSQLGRADTLVIFAKYWGYPISRKLYIYPDVMTQEEISVYSKENNFPLITTKTFSYDKKLRVKEECTTDSRDKQYFTRYTYPDEIRLTSNTSDMPALCMLVDSNQINVPVETVSGFVKDGVDYIMSGKINLYSKDLGTRKELLNILDLDSQSSQAQRSPAFPGTVITTPDWAYKTIEVNYPYLYQTMSLAIASPIEDYKKMTANGDNVTYDSRYKLDAEYKFDAMNRLTSIKPFGQMETKYTWDGIYPTSKTFGNQTWKYSYIPYVGVKQITDPRGINTYYTYDSNGRLIEEYTKDENGNKQILNVYQYHIKSDK